MAYFHGDALESVRQLTGGSGTITLAKAYAPYGEVSSSAGAGASSFGYTGEGADPSGLIYLRSRYYAPQMARFLSRDMWPGSYDLPMSYNSWLYAYANPIRFTDPSGFTSAVGMSFLGMCLDLSTISHGSSYYPEPATAGEAVSICRNAFNKALWDEPSSSGLPTTTSELMSWYIHEYGEEHLYFDGTQPLTKELPKSTLINDIRYMYYQGKDVTGPTFNEFNQFEAVWSLLFDLRNSAYTFNLPLSAFIGSFYSQVITLPNDRVGFRVDNDTTIESGTHIGGRYRDQGFVLSVERLIEQDPSIANVPLGEIISNRDKYRVISILYPRSRSETNGLLGGGDMYQTFTWTEKQDECLSPLMPWEVYAFMFDVQPWPDFQSYTESVFP